MEQRLIKYIVIIVVILVVVFLSQLAYFQITGKTLISNATNQAGAYLSKGSEWVTSKMYPKISGEVQKRGDAIKNDVTNDVTQEKNKVSENILKKVENYFSGITDSILHPGENNNCQAPAQTSTKP